MAIDSPPPGTDTNDLARQQWQRQRVHWRFGLYVLALLVFVGVMAVVERLGLPRAWIAAVFLLAPVALYASVGLACRTTNTAQYFVAGRSVPAIYNGMAIGADWKQFGQALAEVRKRGYAVSSGELFPGRVGYAAPVFAEKGHVLGSLTLIGSTARLDAFREDYIAQRVVATADEITRRLSLQT